MKNKLINFLINFTLVYIFILLFIYSKEIKQGIIVTMNIWYTNLIPSFLPFLIFSALLNNYGAIETLERLLGPVMNKVYNLPSKAAYVLIGSIFTGFPSGSKYTKELLDNNEINSEDANHLITFSSFSNPLFIISVVGEGLLNNKNDGIIIYLCHLISGLIVGLIFKNMNNNYKCLKNKNRKQETFINVLTTSIGSTSKILINMLGIMIYFSIIITIMNILLPNNIIIIIIKGILEVTTGTVLISKEYYNLRLKKALIGALISFNGLSVHYQTKSIIEGSTIKYKNYFFARIIHSLLCFIFIYFI